MPRVSIITRTKNRPLLLVRALASVGSQSFTDWEHLIVNDGGEPGPVDALVGDRARTRVIHNPHSLGMEAASNVGLRTATGELVIIHDDDDSWEREFLEATVGYLDEHASDPFAAGVITHALKVQERIDGNQVVKLDVSPVNDWIETVTLYRLAANNPFPPISFLYRRAVLEEIGYYREDLPVCGDWEFNLRFAARYEIGVVPRPLANYHQRVALQDGIHANSVFFGGGLILRKWESRIRNDLLRRDLRDGKIGLGFLVNLAKSFEDMGGPLRLLGQQQTAFTYFKDKVWSFGTKLGLIRNGQ
jgi:glycosyltransferase involved in cell wall biosynthesis